MRASTRLILAMALCCAGLLGQTVSSSMVGTVLDPANAVVPNAPVKLTAQGSGNIRNATTDDSGTFRFPNIPAGTYNVSVTASGFKTQTVNNVVVEAQQMRALGNILLTLGSVSDQISITAEATPIQLASGERSATIDAAQLETITMKGRDLFGYLKLVPGVIDTSTGRDVTAKTSIIGITINGNTSNKNFTVDGVTNMDTGATNSVHYEPNMDSIQELKVLSSNYQAEYGRNSGGTITVVTKSGGRDFHGTASWNHRHEQFNANSWVNNHTLTTVNGIPGIAQARNPYRFNVATYSIGGPAYIPKLFNTSKSRLFFFWSQEYTRQFVSAATQTRYTPTALERSGDFSKTFNNNGSLVTITDPTTTRPFPNNAIPASQINGTGFAFVNYFPLPNYTPTLPAQLNVVNYYETRSSPYPRRNDVLRLDTYLTSKISGSFRWINDHDDREQLFYGIQFSGRSPGLKGTPMSTIDHPNPGHSYSASSTWTITPTLVNEVTVAESWNTFAFYNTDDFKSEDRSLVPNLPALFNIPTPADSGALGKTNGYQNLLPVWSFGNAPTGNMMTYNRYTEFAGAYENFNPIWTVLDNMSKVVKSHNLKFGFYYEHNRKIQPSTQQYNGNFNFATGTGSPLINTGDGLVNALLGNVNSYTQATARTAFNVVFNNFEFYAQDNWKVGRRLTIDAGLRVYWQQPPHDLNHTFVNFSQTAYSKAAIGRIYQPFCANGVSPCSGTNYVARDPGTGTTVSSANVGNYVPGSGSSTSGLQVLGVSGSPQYAYSQSLFGYAPRIGFAYDLTGDGKTAVRGGWGIFYNRLDGDNSVHPLSGQAPVVYTQTVTNTTFAGIAALNKGALDLNTLSVAPNAPNAWAQVGDMPRDAVQNASFDIQRSVGASTVVDLGYTFNHGYNQNLTYNINSIPLGTNWPFTQANVNPAVANTTLAPIFERTKFPGYNGINSRAFLGHTNYHALMATLSRRLTRGLAWGATYTFSKALGATAFSPVVADNEKWNYGRLGSDRRHNLQINYIYDIPGLAKHMNAKFLGLITDRWQLSGITSFQSGAPFNPSCGLASGTTPDYTGTPDLGARCNVVGDPLANITQNNGNGTIFFNPAAYALPAIATGPNNSIVGPPVTGTQGGGAGILSLPSYTNFDVTMTKNIPLGSERRVLRIQAQAYNVFNHTQISGIGTGIQFSPTTGAVNNASSLGYVTAARPARILAFSARFQF
ncbi:MAG: carboxypeptidase regulatory-like domain-containing protein [Candidatus Solibacter sp.]